MAWNLPIMRAAIELLEHALEHCANGEERDRRIAVLHLAQVVELGAKAALVSRNEPVYEKGGNKTLTVHQALDKVEEILGKRLPARARIEFLVDDRNAIQHRYGALDPETLEFHRDSVLTLFATILDEFFDTDLHEFIRDTFDDEVWRKIPCLQAETADKIDVAEARVQSNPQIAFIEAFSIFEGTVRDQVRSCGLNEPLSTLDVVMKFLGNWSGPNCGLLITDIPKVYKTRNSVVHGSRLVHSEEAASAVETMKTVLDLLRAPENRAALQNAVAAGLAGRRARDVGLGRLSAPSGESGPPPDEGGCN